MILDEIAEKTRARVQKEKKKSVCTDHERACRVASMSGKQKVFV